MTIDTAIKAFLNVTPDPVGTESRNYFRIAPERPTQPYMVFGHATTENTFLTQCGPPLAVEERWQFSVWAESQSSAFAIATTLRRLLNGYHGLLGTLTVSSRFEMHTYAYDSETKLHGEHLFFCLIYS